MCEKGVYNSSGQGAEGRGGFTGRLQQKSSIHVQENGSAHYI